MEVFNGDPDRKFCRFFHERAHYAGTIACKAPCPLGFAKDICLFVLRFVSGCTIKHLSSMNDRLCEDFFVVAEQQKNPDLHNLSFILDKCFI